MRWLSLFVVVGCTGPESGKKDYVHEVVVFDVDAAGERNTSGYLVVAEGRRQLSRKQLGRRLKPFDVVDYYGQWTDDLDDGEFEFTSSMTEQPDGSFIQHEDVDDDGLADGTVWLNAATNFTRYETTGLEGFWTYDTADRVLDSRQTRDAIFGPEVSTVAYTYEGDSDDWVTREEHIGGALVSKRRRELDANGNWNRDLSVNGTDEVEIAWRTNDEAGNPLELVVIDGQGETLYISTFDDFGGLLTREQSREGALLARIVYQRDKRGFWSHYTFDEDGDGTVDRTLTGTVEVDPYGRAILTETKDEGVVVNRYERVLLGTPDEVDLDPFPIEAVDFDQ